MARGPLNLHQGGTWASIALSRNEPRLCIHAMTPSRECESSFELEIKVSSRENASSSHPRSSTCASLPNVLLFSLNNTHGTSAKARATSYYNMLNYPQVTRNISCTHELIIYSM